MPAAGPPEYADNNVGTRVCDTTVALLAPSAAATPRNLRPLPKRGFVFGRADLQMAHRPTHVEADAPTAGHEAAEPTPMMEDPQKNHHLWAKKSRTPSLRGPKTILLPEIPPPMANIEIASAIPKSPSAMIVSDTPSRSHA